MCSKYASYKNCSEWGIKLDRCLSIFSTSRRLATCEMVRTKKHGECNRWTIFEAKGTRALPLDLFYINLRGIWT